MQLVGQSSLKKTDLNRSKLDKGFNRYCPVINLSRLPLPNLSSSCNGIRVHIFEKVQHKEVYMFNFIK